MPGYGTDCFTGEDGASLWVMELDLSRLDVETIRNHANLTQDVRDRMLAYAQQANAAIAANTDANGYLSLRMNYRVYTFSDGEIDYNQHTDGTLTFKVKTK